jgi:hypothetical protein
MEAESAMLELAQPIEAVAVRGALLDHKHQVAQVVPAS